MEGGIICDCSPTILKELGKAAPHFNNFQCANCKRIVHLHGTSEQLVDNATLCADCDAQDWKSQIDKYYR